MPSKRQGSFFPGSVIVASVAALVALGACTKSGDSEQISGMEAPDSASMKAVAEAEAAEEAFAKEKKMKAEKRTVASVKKPAKKANAESIFVVQVGTFAVEANAIKVAEKLKAAGLPVVQKKIERANGTVYYTVRFEPTPNRMEAEKFVSSVKAATGESSLILSVGN